MTRGRDVGVDTEGSDRAVEVDDIAEQFFAPTEAASLLALNGKIKLRRFFNLWTLKESYVKARGLGIKLPLNAFSFAISDKGPVEIHFNSLNDDDPRNWYFALLEPIANQVIAVAVARAENEDKESWRSDIQVATREFDEDVLARARLNFSSAPGEVVRTSCQSSRVRALPTGSGAGL